MVTVTANKVVLVVVGVCVEDLEGHDDDEIKEEEKNGKNQSTADTTKTTTAILGDGWTG